ncbi:pyrroline-5-carboxylate reductase [Kitasatospora sp. NPDC059827]|uniref:pyrroline-5-carboxylate reductase n=1 Tax=Kitasatospora sp. NPDC059827 TaxID=3346964 RepID=UPI0036659F88
MTPVDSGGNVTSGESLTAGVDRVVVIGAGHMGTAIISGLLRRTPDLPLEIVETAESRARLLHAEFGLEPVARYRPQPGDAVVLAIQPQAFEGFAADQEAGAFEGALVISVMAGVSIAAMTALLRTDRVVRAIPNTPSEVAQGMTVLCPGATVPVADVRTAERLLSSIGRALTVRDEALIDDATALCGGGPAFVAHIAGAFIDFAVTAGFDRAQARSMTTQVLRGTAELLDSTEHSPEELCRQVMTPGGTTEQGIFHFQELGLQSVLVGGLTRSADRSRELGGIGR